MRGGVGETRDRGEAASVSGCLLRSVKGTFIGMSESRRGIINGAEAATSVPCGPARLQYSKEVPKIGGEGNSCQGPILKPSVTICTNERTGRIRGKEE
jgi:hypothetical protein